MESHKNKLPSAWVSALPLAVLTLLLYVVIRCFGGDAITVSYTHLTLPTIA